MTSAATEPTEVDAVVVAYNSGDTLRACVAPLAATAGVAVTVVDNASPDDGAERIADLPVALIRTGRNGGFAFGCNRGIAAGTAPWVLLINPDGVIAADDLRALVAAGGRDPAIGVVGPRILDADGRLAFSQRRFARLRSTFSQALFLHRLAPAASWSDEIVRDRAAYDAPASPEWISGACMLLRRAALEQVGGLDERFFLYREDMDLCRRLRAAGWDVRYEPAATARHIGGASSGEGETLPIFAASRLAYARAHSGRAAAQLERLGVALWACTHWLASLSRPGRRRGHASALRVALRGGS
jgi:GT2 family glycosyltransferase